MMKKISNILLITYGLKCLWAFIQKDATIFDGAFFIAVVMYFAVKIDIALPVDQK